jgi:crotonobetainyl-CoA:carnitine CoA-transferase CaiB-like acyl-CoA transferase
MLLDNPTSGNFIRQIEDAVLLGDAPQPFELLDDPGEPRQPKDREVELLVEPKHRVDSAITGGTRQFSIQSFERRERGCVRPGDSFEGLGLDHAAHKVDLPEIFGPNDRHEVAAIRLMREQALSLQTSQGLPHRDPAYAENLRELLLVDLLSRSDLAAHDQLAQSVHDSTSGAERRCGLRFRATAGGDARTIPAPSQTDGAPAAVRDFFEYPMANTLSGTKNRFQTAPKLRVPPARRRTATSPATKTVPLTVKRARWPSSAKTRGRPLHGVKVLDLTRVLAGPFCTMLLADLGASVLKVEAPTGDETRRWGPPFHRGTATYFFGTNRNKWDIVLDLSKPEARSVLADFIIQADVVVQNFTGATARRLGVDYETVAAVNPQAIHLTLWSLGPEQPEQRGYDLVIQALTGMMAITGEQGGPAVKVGAPISDLAAGLYSANAVTAQLFDRLQTKRGARLDVSLYDAALSLLANQSMSWLLSKEETPRLGSEHPVITPYGAYRTGDGAMIIAVGTDAQFEALAKVLLAPTLAEDERYRLNRSRVRHRNELRVAIEAITTTRPSEEWRTQLDAVGIPNAVIRSIGEALDSADTHSKARIEHPTWGNITQVMSPIRVNGEYLAPYLAPPTLGEHTRDILEDATDS